MARAKSKTSIDTKFAIYYRNGEIRDDYESYVLGKFNTLQRLSDEYSAIAKNIIAEESGYENNTTIVIFKKEDQAKDIFELDMEFDKSSPLESEVMIRLDLRDSSLEGFSRILTDTHKAFEENDCNFSEYGLSAEKGNTHVSVHGVILLILKVVNLLLFLKKLRIMTMEEESASLLRKTEQGVRHRPDTLFLKILLKIFKSY